MGLRTATGARKPAWAAYRFAVVATRRGRRAARLVYRLGHRTAGGEAWHSRAATAGRPLRYRSG